MRYISLGNSEYFSVGTGVSVSSKEGENWGDRVAYVVPADFGSIQGLAYIKQTKRMLSSAGVRQTGDRLSPVGTILLQRRGHQVPRVGILRVPAVASDYFLVVRVTNSNLLLPDYVAMMLDASKQQISHFSAGSVMKYLKRDTLLSMQIPIVTLKEQKRVIEGH